MFEVSGLSTANYVNNHQQIPVQTPSVTNANQQPSTPGPAIDFGDAQGATNNRVTSGLDSLGSGNIL
jgi:hypothetical protein